MSLSREQQGKGLDSGTKALGDRVTACCCTKTWQKPVQLVYSKTVFEYSSGVLFYAHILTESPSTQLSPHLSPHPPPLRPCVSLSINTTNMDHLQQVRTEMMISMWVLMSNTVSD
jgi:hypothetical protein